MTKTELIKENERLEQELHNANNSYEYWKNEHDMYFSILEELKDKINKCPIIQFSLTCDIVQKQKLLDIIDLL